MRMGFLTLFLFFLELTISLAAESKRDSLVAAYRSSQGEENFTACLELARYYDSVDSLKLAENFFLEAIQIGEKQKGNISLQLAYRYLGLFYVETWQPEKAEIYLEKGIQTAISRKDEKTLLLCKVDLGILYSRKMEIDSAGLILDEALYLAVKQADNLAVVSILTSMAYLDEKFGDILEAIGLYHQIIEKCQENQFLPEQGIMYNNLGNIYRNLDASISLEYLMKADSIAGLLKDDELRSLVSLNKGFTLIQAKNPAAAEVAFKSAATLSARVGDSLRLAQAYGGISHVLLGQNDCRTAAVYLDSAFIIINKKENDYGRFTLGIEYALIQNCLGNKKQALKSLQELLTVAESEKILPVQAEITHYLYELLLDLGQPQVAYSYLEKHLEYQNELSPDSLITQAVLLYDAQRFAQEKKSFAELTEKRNAQNATLWWIVAVLSVVVLALIYLLILYHRRLNRQTHLDETFTKKVEEIKSIIQESTGEAAMDESDDELGDDETFMAYINYVYPDLSKLEVKICGLIRSNHTTKDIANILGRSVGTIDNHRSAIRKKLDVSDAINLPLFLQNIRKSK